jgi:chitinase
MASTAANRHAFARSCLAFLDQYGLNCLDLDWEYPGQRGGGPEDRANYTLLVRDLAQALQHHGTYRLSLAIPASPWTLQHFDLRQLAQWVHVMHLMAYDLHGTDCSGAGFPHGQKYADPC